MYFACFNQTFQLKIDDKIWKKITLLTIKYKLRSISPGAISLWRDIMKRGKNRLQNNTKTPLESDCYTKNKR
jgi:hypothetical protein